MILFYHEAEGKTIENTGKAEKHTTKKEGDKEKFL